MTGGWLDWRENSVGPARPCRICDRPALCRDEHGRPCHKLCAERLPAVAEDGSAALVIDLEIYRGSRITRRHTA
jgi:hypothetical protein